MMKPTRDGDDSRGAVYRMPDDATFYDVEEWLEELLNETAEDQTGPPVRFPVVIRVRDPKNRSSARVCDIALKDDAAVDLTLQTIDALVGLADTTERQLHRRWINKCYAFFETFRSPAVDEIVSALYTARATNPDDWWTELTAADDAGEMQAVERRAKRAAQRAKRHG